MSKNVKSQLINTIRIYGIHLHMSRINGYPRWAQVKKGGKICRDEPDRCFLLKIKNLRKDT